MPDDDLLRDAPPTQDDLDAAACDEGCPNCGSRLAGGCSADYVCGRCGHVWKRAIADEFCVEMQEGKPTTHAKEERVVADVHEDKFKGECECRGTVEIKYSFSPGLLTWDIHCITCGNTARVQEPAGFKKVFTIKLESQYRRVTDP